MRTEQVTNKSIFWNNTASDSVWSNSREVLYDFSLNLTKATGLFLNTTFRNIKRKSSNATVIEASLQSELHFSFSNISEIYGIDVNSHFIHITNNTLLKIHNSTIEKNNIPFLIDSVNNSNLIIENSIFIKNKAGYSCLRVFNGTLHMIRSSFTENEIGAVAGEFSSYVFISGCTFEANRASSIVFQYYKAILEIETSIFKNNVSPRMDPCICVNFEVSVKLRDSTFFNNTGMFTGSICISNSEATINNVSFSANVGVQASCIYAPKNAKVNVTGCRFDSNREGSVVYATPGSKLGIVNSTFTDHVLSEDSLIEIEKSSLDLINCTIMNNAMGKIGGIVQASTYCEITVRNCMFDQNAGRYGAVFYMSIKSSLFISDSQFHNNVASVGGCVYLLDSILDITESIFNNNTAHVYAGAIAAERSNITMKLSHFHHHESGDRGGVLDMTNSTLVAQNCSMENNSAYRGAAIYKSLNGKIILDGCWLNMNRAQLGVIWYWHYIDSIFRLSHTSCFTCGNCGPCIEFVGKDGYNFTMYTLNFSISKKGISLSSTEQNFASEALECGVIISDEGKKIYLTETAFASGIKCYFLIINEPFRSMYWYLENGSKTFC